jgi:Family of unknown function (DUF6152)
MSTTKSIRTAIVCGSVIAIALLGRVTPVQAHHSFGMFDRSKQITISGSVRKFDWANPHVIILVDVLDPKAVNGAVRYTVETGSPSKCADLGWKFNEFKPGDKVHMTIYPLRDGRPGGSFVRATMEDGKIVGSYDVDSRQALPR